MVMLEEEIKEVNLDSTSLRLSRIGWNDGKYFSFQGQYQKQKNKEKVL